MSHFAYVKDGRVIDVIVAEQDFIDHIEANGHPNYPPGYGRWIQTSYNTRGGQHTLGGTPLRKNFAGMGYHYDEVADAFYPPRPFDTWSLNNETFLWEAPVPMPQDGNLYLWNPMLNNWEIWMEGTAE